MAAVSYRLRSAMRSRWPAMVLLMLTVAAVSGAVIALAGGAQRTLSAPDRYIRSLGGTFDALITQQDGGAPMTAQVEALPGVSSAASMTFAFAGLSRNGSLDTLDCIVFAGQPAANSLHVVSGRLPELDEPGGFVATRDFVSVNGLHVGDSLQLVGITQEEADTGGFALDAVPAISRPVVLVGVVDGPTTFNDPTPLAMFSPSLLDAEPTLGVSQTLISVRLRHGVDVTALRAEVDAIPGGRQFSVGPSELISDYVRRAVRTIGVGLWLLAIVGGIFAMVVLGQLLVRQVRLSEYDRARLKEIGCTDAHLLAESAVRAAMAIVPGVILGAVIAWTVSGLFPSGFVRRLEPEPGVLFDPAVLAGGIALFVVVLSIWSVVALLLWHRPARSVGVSPVVEGIAARTGSPAAAIGIRFAFTRRNRDRASVRGPLVAVASTIAVLCGALVFGASMDRLIDEPARYGGNYDILLGNNGAEQMDPALQARLQSDPNVTSLMFYASSHARHGDDDVPLLGLTAVRGTGAPVLVEGRLPAASDEVAFGGVSLRAVGAGLGDQIELTGASGAARYRITGIAVVPGLGANEGVGEGAVMTMEGLAAIDTGSGIASAAIRVVDWRRSPELVESFSANGLDAPPPPFRPAVIDNIVRVRAIPYVLAGLLAVLVMITIANVMLTAVRGRRRDLVVLRALGAETHWVSRVVHWHATTFITVCALIGVPVGVVLGSSVFTSFAEGMGALSSPARPAAWVAGATLTLVVLANLVAALPGRQARRWVPAQVQQAE